jgi:hypothetical protein
MPGADDQFHPIKYTAVYLRLKRQPLQSVTVALQFNPSELPVDYGNVDSNRPGPKTHFLNDSRIAIVAMVAIQPA